MKAPSYSVFLCSIAVGTDAVYLQANGMIRKWEIKKKIGV